MKTSDIITDEELAELGEDRFHDLVDEYRLLAKHHIEETTNLRAKDRGAILRMAGNIAAGLVTEPSMTYREARKGAQEVAEAAVAIARAILAEVDA